jgi:hypothetical protein
VVDEEHKDVSRPRVSKKMREMLKKAGKQVNIKEMVQAVEKTPAEEVSRI